MIAFHLDNRSGVPAYMQLTQQVRQAIRLGTLRPGDQLPTVKEVVATLTINPNVILTVTSGVIFDTAGSTLTIIGGGTLAFGTTEGIIQTGTGAAVTPRNPLCRGRRMSSRPVSRSSVSRYV